MFKEMEKLISGFPEDIKQSITEHRNLGKPNLKPFNKILITGLGGSGIGGSMVAEALVSTAKMPIVVNKDYSVPAWVDEQTLVIASSYSGNTEETISAATQAKKQGAQLAAITSGGQLLKMAEADSFPVVHLPEGYPPRAAFGHSSVALFAFLGACEVAPWNANEFLKMADHLTDKQDDCRRIGKEIAKKIDGRIPVLYAAEGLGAVAVRWRQQINENGKSLCWHHIVPEMNHNELVGWAGGDNRLAVIMLRSSDDHPRSALRMDLNRDLISEKTNVVEEVQAVGSNQLERMYYLIAVGDWMSLYISENRGVDPVEVDVISHLKSELAKH